MCFNTQKTIRIDAELCDAIQTYAFSNRIALKPRWFSDFINSAVREKLSREGFLDSASGVSPALAPRSAEVDPASRDAQCGNSGGSNINSGSLSLLGAGVSDGGNGNIAEKEAL